VPDLFFVGIDVEAMGKPISSSLLPELLAMFGNSVKYSSQNEIF
jgi:hypothetical protein